MIPMPLNSADARSPILFSFPPTTLIMRKVTKIYGRLFNINCKLSLGGTVVCRSYPFAIEDPPVCIYSAPILISSFFYFPVVVGDFFSLGVSREEIFF